MLDYYCNLFKSSYYSYYFSEEEEVEEVVEEEEVFVFNTFRFFYIF
jgi:hypothetical protein